MHMEKVTKGITSFQLKLLGIVLMVFDHLGQFFGFLGAPVWFHWLGRLVAPIFLFTSSEGFIYTSNRKKYLLRLLYGFWLMGIGNIIANKFFMNENEVLINNIFGTLFLGVLYMWFIDEIRKNWKLKQPLKVVGGFILCIVPIVLSFAVLLLMDGMDSKASLIIFRMFTFLVPLPILSEGGPLFILLAVLFYLFHGKKSGQLISLAVIAVISFISGTGNPFTENYQWMMCLAAVPIILYNGEKGRGMRNFFYYFYPAHIYLFCLIAYFIQH